MQDAKKGLIYKRNIVERKEKTSDNLKKKTNSKQRTKVSKVGNKGRNTKVV
jgi:hypothetical protein